MIPFFFSSLISKSYLLFLQNISRIWPLLIASITTTGPSQNQLSIWPTTVVFYLIPYFYFLPNVFALLQTSQWDFFFFFKVNHLKILSVSSFYAQNKIQTSYNDLQHLPTSPALSPTTVPGVYSNNTGFLPVAELLNFLSTFTLVVPSAWILFPKPCIAHFVISSGLCSNVSSSGRAFPDSLFEIAHSFIGFFLIALLRYILHIRKFTHFKCRIK